MIKNYGLSSGFFRHMLLIGEHFNNLHEIKNKMKTVLTNVGLDVRSNTKLLTFFKNQNYSLEFNFIKDLM